MTFCSLLIRNWPTGVAQYMNNMNETTEAEFATSITYAAIEVACQLLTFLLLQVLIQRFSDFDLIGIGVVILKANLVYYVVATGAGCLFFYDMFLQHHGVDVTFAFKWFR